MATTTKNMQVVAGNANASVTAQVTDSMPGVPCPGPAGYTYKGLRYVPVFADPIEWNSANSYEALTIVLFQGDSYTSVQAVPVGIDIANNNFWAKTGNFNAQLELYRREVENLKKTINKAYSSVTSMIADTEVEVGKICYCAGYAIAGDGGEGNFVITSTETALSIKLTNEKYAAYIVGDYVNAASLGFHYSVEDNSEVLQKCVNFCSSNGSTLTFPKNTYNVETIVTGVTNGSLKVKGNGALITSSSLTTVIDFSMINDLFCDELCTDKFIKFRNYGTGSITAERKRNVVLNGCYNFNLTGEPINSCLYLANKAPSNYTDNSGGDYSRYSLEINNNSGYNALMITNTASNEDGTITSAAENSAIGITDQVSNTNAPVILIQRNGNRALFKAYSANNNTLIDIGGNNLALGCPTNESTVYPTANQFKMASNTPSFALISTNGTDAPNSVFQGYVDGSGVHINCTQLKGTIEIGSDFVIPHLLVDGNSDNALTFKCNTPSGYRTIYTDTNGYLRSILFKSSSGQTDGPLLLSSVSGSSAERPTTISGNDYKGYQFFDTTLNKPIWYNGSGWVDATGASV